MAGVEALVLAALAEDGAGDEADWLTNLLRGYRPAPQVTQDQLDALEAGIHDRLRAATNANFAAAGGGLKLEKR